MFEYLFSGSMTLKPCEKQYFNYAMYGTIYTNNYSGDFKLMVALLN